ncbi:MAG: glutamine synthetase beta-grasp domain-containing protein [Deltaproteobacteria bacterium]|nr:glutamine synthetase beta-grasp domain-containing protein [Deltaproteobacteria bacterium]
MVSIKDVKENLKNTDSTKIFFTDLNGRLTSLTINPDDIDFIIEKGVGFDGSSIAGMATVDNSDRLLFPDPESFHLVQFKDDRIGFFIGHIHRDPEHRALADPRAVLENVLAEVESEHGFKFMVGPEHEFFLLTQEEFGENIHSDNAGYFLSTP